MRILFSDMCFLAGLLANANSLQVLLDFFQCLINTETFLAIFFFRWITSCLGLFKMSLLPTNFVYFFSKGFLFRLLQCIIPFPQNFLKFQNRKRLAGIYIYNYNYMYIYWWIFFFQPLQLWYRAEPHRITQKELTTWALQLVTWSHRAVMRVLVECLSACSQCESSSSVRCISVIDQDFSITLLLSLSSNIA